MTRARRGRHARPRDQIERRAVWALRMRQQAIYAVVVSRTFLHIRQTLRLERQER